jgi:membrane protein required for colicin V production
MMAGADYLIVAVLAVSVIVGFARGFIREAIALAAWVIGVWLAWRFPEFVYPYLGGLVAETPARDWAARTIIVVAALLLGAMVGAIVSWTVRAAVVLATIDRIVGVIFGAVRGVVIVAVLVVIGQALHLDSQSWWTRSRLLPYAGVVASSLSGVARETGVGLPVADAGQRRD